MRTQTYPFTRYYLRVPGEHKRTWVPVRIGASAIPAYWENSQEANAYAQEIGFADWKVIEVTERVVS